MNRTFKTAVATLMLAVGLAGSVAAGPFEDAFAAFADSEAAGPFEDAFAAYERGDYATALRLMRPLAEEGNASAQNSLGLMYLNGQGLPQDYAAALSWYRKAAERGKVTAQYSLGVMYYNGQGVPEDYVIAHKWFNLAAATGNQDAVKSRDIVAAKMTPAQIAEAQKMAREWKPK